MNKIKMEIKKKGVSKYFYIYNIDYESNRYNMPSISYNRRN